jgi:hypothetical protein
MIFIAHSEPLTSFLDHAVMEGRHSYIEKGQSLPVGSLTLGCKDWCGHIPSSLFVLVCACVCLAVVGAVAC